MKDIYVLFGTAGQGNKIEGETRDKAFPKNIEVTSWQHMIRQPRSATASTAGGHTAERCEHGDMVFTKDIDKTSPVLWEACSAGTSYDTVVIQFLRSGGIATDALGGRTVYLKVTLKNVIIASVTPQVLGEGLPTETFGLKYASVKWEYTGQDLNGRKAAGGVGSWSLTLNKATDSIV